MQIQKQNLDNPERCLVTSYLHWSSNKQQRPAEMANDGSPFYLAINTEVPKAEDKKWQPHFLENKKCCNFELIRVLKLFLSL